MVRVDGGAGGEGDVELRNQIDLMVSFLTLRPMGIECCSIAIVPFSPHLMTSSCLSSFKDVKFTVSHVFPFESVSSLNAWSAVLSTRWCCEWDLNWLGGGKLMGGGFLDCCSSSEDSYASTNDIESKKTLDHLPPPFFNPANSESVEPFSLMCAQAGSLCCKLLTFIHTYSESVKSNCFTRRLKHMETFHSIQTI